jgi:ketosteroid isomerase-like protein
MLLMRLFGILMWIVIAPVANANDEVAIHQLLNDFLANTVKDDLKNHQRFWADDLIYTSSSGARFGKEKIIQGITEESSTSVEDTLAPTYAAEETRIRLYGTTAVVAFKLVATSKETGKQKTHYYFNTGTFLKRNEVWQVVAWQATKIPEPPTTP